MVVYARDEDWSTGWKTILDLSGEGHLDKNNPVLIETQNSERIPIAGNTPVKHYVRFNPLGEPLLSRGAFQAGTLHICQAKTAQSHHQVVLAKSGRISLRSDQAAQALCAVNQVMARTRSSLGIENVTFSSRPANSSAPVAPQA